MGEQKNCDPGNDVFIAVLGKPDQNRGIQKMQTTAKSTTLLSNSTITQTVQSKYINKEKITKKKRYIKLWKKY